MQCYLDVDYLFIRYCTLSCTTASLCSSSRLNKLSSIPSDLKDQKKPQINKTFSLNSTDSLNAESSLSSDPVNELYVIMETDL